MNERKKWIVGNGWKTNSGSFFHMLRMLSNDIVTREVGREIIVLHSGKEILFTC